MVPDRLGRRTGGVGVVDRGDLLEKFVGHYPAATRRSHRCRSGCGQASPIKLT